MKKKLITLLSLSLITANMAFAEYAFVDSSDFTGDAFFTPPALEEKQVEAKKANDFGRTPTLPPIKKLRIKIKKLLKKEMLVNMNWHLPLNKKMFMLQVQKHLNMLQKI